MISAESPSIALEKREDYYADKERKEVKGSTGTELFYLEDAIGASSAAFSAIVENLAFLDGAEPQCT